MITVTLNYTKGSGPSGDRTALNTTMNTLFQHRSTGWDAKNLAGTDALENEIVWSINDQISGHHLGYSGYDGPNPDGLQAPMLGKPFLVKQSGILSEDIPFIFMKNQEGIQYDSEERSGLGKNSIWGFVWFQPDYAIYEAYSNHFTRPYLGEMKTRSSSSTPFGTLTLRTTNETTYQVESTIRPNAINCFIMQMIDDGQASESGRVSVRLWTNGTLLNPSTHLETFYRPSISEGFGTDTNCEMMGVIENFNKYGTMTDTEIGNVFTALNAYYGTLGTKVDLPIATDVYASRSGNIITAHYTFVPASSGSPENVSARKVVWETGPSLQRMAQKTAVDNLMSFDRSLHGDWTGPIRLNIYVEDMAGKKFKIPGATFTNI